MKLYLLAGCPFAHRATIALQEKGLEFEPVFFQAKQRPRELDEAGPFAKSPTLFDGETVVWDAQVVLEYLEDRFPHRPLLPADAAGRAEARMLMTRTNQELGPIGAAMAAELFFKPSPDPAQLADAKARFVAALPWWNERLTGRDFLLGSSLTLADIPLYTMFTTPLRAGAEIPPELGALRAWHERIQSRPAAAPLKQRV
jgi:RNA polymerase-associated protein